MHSLASTKIRQPPRLKRCFHFRSYCITLKFGLNAECFADCPASHRSRQAGIVDREVVGEIIIMGDWCGENNNNNNNYYSSAQLATALLFDYATSTRKSNILWTKLTTINYYEIIIVTLYYRNTILLIAKQTTIISSNNFQNNYSFNKFISSTEYSIIIYIYILLILTKSRRLHTLTCDPPTKLALVSPLHIYLNGCPP